LSKNNDPPSDFATLNQQHSKVQQRKSAEAPGRFKPRETFTAKCGSRHRDCDLNLGDLSECESEEHKAKSDTDSDRSFVTLLGSGGQIIASASGWSRLNFTFLDRLKSA